MKFRFTRAALAALVAGLASSTLLARPRPQQAPSVPTAQTIPLTATIPLDPAVATGKLQTGLTYYIRKNSRPADRVMLRLAVKAGSRDEADDQQGLAHMLEHMAF